MATLQDSLVSSTARELPIKVRPDLEAVASRYLGRLYWVVKDPIGMRYFRFHEEEYALLKMLDGTRSLDQIKAEFESRFPPQKIGLATIQTFLTQLHQSGLVISSLAGQGDELLSRRVKRDRAATYQWWTNILAVRLKGFDPDAILTQLLPWVRWCFSPVAQIAAVLLCLAAATLVIVEFETFQSKLPEFKQFFSVRNIFLMSVVLGLTKILHEFGHGLTVKYFGGECHQMGVMFLVLTPCLYVDASDSWMLPNKWHRIAIAAAGVWVECVLAAICTFVWWFSAPGMLHYLCLNVMFVCSVSTVVFNINPLLRYDGYYIAADWLEIPNLRQKAQKILTRTCGHLFLGIKPPDDPFLPERNQTLFALYAVAAFCYRWLVTASILFFLYHVFKPWGLQIIGQTIAVFSLVSLVIMPLVQLVKFFWVPGRTYQVKRRNFWISVAALTLVAAAVCCVPLPYSVVVPAVIELDSTASRMLFVPQVAGGGRLVDVPIRVGTSVTQGTVLGELENLTLEMELCELLGRAGEYRQQLENLERLSLERPETASQIGVLRESLAATEVLYREKRQVYEALTLRAPCDGVIVSPPSRAARETDDDILPSWSGSPLVAENRGAMLDPGTLFCSVGDPEKLAVVAVVDQSQIDFLRSGQNACAWFDAVPQTRHNVTIRQIEKRQTDTVPIQLSTRGGGDVPTVPTPEGMERPQGAAFRVEMPLSDGNAECDTALSPGMTGLAKISVAPQTLARRLLRWFQETFHFRL
ncbi:MAG: site-2 protease family protein [Thermoguttaceae bacterium]